MENKKISITLAIMLVLGMGSVLALRPGNMTIVEIVLEDDGEFDVLQEAVISAGLVDVLNGKGQYTVFAPTDEAFVSLLGAENEADAISIVQSLPQEDLKNILLYHVINGRRSSTSVIRAPMYNTLLGEKLSRQDVFNAGLVQVDISASNGIIHVIDNVLLP